MLDIVAKRAALRSHDNVDSDVSVVKSMAHSINRTTVFSTSNLNWLLVQLIFILCTIYLCFLVCTSLPNWFKLVDLFDNFVVFLLETNALETKLGISKVFSKILQILFCNFCPLGNAIYRSFWPNFFIFIYLHLNIFQCSTTPICTCNLLQTIRILCKSNGFGVLNYIAFFWTNDANVDLVGGVFICFFVVALVIVVAHFRTVVSSSCNLTTAPAANWLNNSLGIVVMIFICFSSVVYNPSNRA